MGLFSANDDGKIVVKVTLDEQLYKAYLYHKKDGKTFDEAVEQMMRDVVDRKPVSEEPQTTVRKSWIKSNGNLDNCGNRGAFIDYMQNVAINTHGKHYSYVAVHSYVNGIDSFIAVFDKDLWNMNTAQDVRNAFYEFYQTDKYLLIKQKTKGAVNAAINLYIKYLERNNNN